MDEIKNTSRAIVRQKKANVKEFRSDILDFPSKERDKE